MKARKKLAIFLKLSWSISPAYLFMLLFSTLVSSGQILLNVILPKYLIDELTGAQDLGRLLIFGGLIVGSNLFFALLSNITKRYMDAKNVYITEMMQEKMAEKIMNVEYSFLETPHYLDLKERAMFAIRNQSALMTFVTESAALLKNVITLAGLIAVMATLSLVLVGALVLIIAIGQLISAKLMREQLKFMQSIIPYNREYGYYINLCYDDRAQKDIRLYDMNGMIIDKVDHYNREINGYFHKFYCKRGRYSGISGILADLQAAITYGYVALRVFTSAAGPRIGIGSFTMYVNAAINFTKAASELGSNIVRMVQVMGYLDPFAEFMALPDAKDFGGTAPMDDDIREIRFENVSFHYPGSDVRVLNDVSFTIQQGEKVSIVGLNGAGKTTLVKLICRLYRPSSGTITINGRDIFDYDHEQYMRRIAAVFQDYKLFAFTLEENITGIPAGGDEGGALAVASQVGLDGKLSRLEQGLGTLLGKAYNEEGTEFSGGEQQKVAIARALYKQASLIILDEPTSALDPLAEAEIYENFNALVGDKTALYISHRMSSSVFCDRILILDGGHVADFAPHAELMQKTDGLYYKLFMSQADNYRIEAEKSEDALLLGNTFPHTC